MAPRKQVDDLPGFGQAPNPASSPQGVIAFAPRSSPLLELAQSLGGVRREFDQMANKRLEEISAQETEAGRLAAMKDDFKSWRELVAAGKAPPSEHPAFYTAYEQQKGRVTGQAYAAFINEKIGSWEGAGSDDMSGGALLKALPEWRREFFDKLGQTTNEFMTGVMAYAEQSENNLLSQHIAEARRTAEENMGTQIYNELYNVLSDPSLTKEQMFAKFDEVYARQDYIGLRNKIGPLLMQALTDKAVDEGDVDLIDKVREYTRTDSRTGQRLPILKNTKATATLDKARRDAARSAVTLDNLRRTQEDQARSEVTRNAVAEAVKKGEAVDPVKFASEVAANGGDAYEALRAGNAVSEIQRNGVNLSNSDRINDLFLEMMTKPDPKKKLTDYLVELRGLDAGRSELVQATEVYNEYVANGRTVFSDRPELQELAARLNAGGAGFQISQEEKQQNLRDIAAAARSILPNSKAKTPEQFAKEVEVAVEKRKQAREKAAMQFAPTSAPTVETTARGASSDKVSAAPTGSQSTTPLGPVATSAELAALVGKPVEIVDRFIQSKPVLPASDMALALQQVAKGSRGPEALRLERVMQRLGINTTDMRKATLELLNRGQRRFLATAKQPTK